MAAKKVMLEVEEASKKSRFWRSVGKLLSRPGRRMPEVNVGKIAHLTTPGDRVVVPGKVLGKGEIGHSITVAAFSFSSSALAKLRSAGCTVMRLDEFARSEPKGSGVKIIV
ncbi:MAG: 50S ribosomal protein L18e [Thermoproteota archaeon]